MKILIYDINYTPELTGVGKYTGEMGSWLAQKGHSITVITAMPYYPEWEVHDRYKNKLWLTETIDDVIVHRCPFYVPKKVTSIKRILHEFSFVLSSLVYWIPVFFSKRYDVVMCVSPPFHIGLLPVLYSKLRNVPLWMHLQDLQIDMAKELGMLTNQKFLKLLYYVETFILKRSTIVSVISEGMVKKAAMKNVIRSECIFFPNWVDSHYIKPLSKSDSLRNELGLHASDQVILYSGSLGEKQGLDLIVKAAKHFATNTKVKFIVSGSGGGKRRLELLASQYGLTNIFFHPLQPYEKLSALLATADVHLVLQRKSASDLVLPSKLTSILAAGGYAIVSAVPGTTLYEVVDTHCMGLLIEPESETALTQGIEFALSTDTLKYRQNARTYAQNYLDKSTILYEFEKELLNLQGVVKERLLV